MGPSGLVGPGGWISRPFTTRKPVIPAARTSGSMLAGTYQGGLQRAEVTKVASCGVAVRRAPTMTRDRITSRPLS